MSIGGVVLVTGSNGFLGTQVVERLIAHGGKRVRALVRPGSDRRKLDAIVAAARPGAVEVVTGGLASPAAIAPLLEDVDVVYHLAAGVRGSPADVFMNTVVPTKHLCEAMLARRPTPTMVLCSSFSVYGVADLARGALLDEDTPLEHQPERRDPYTQGKLRQELLAREYAAKGMPLVVMRPGTIYGPGGGALSGRVGINVPGLFIHLGGRNLLPLTYVDNCAEAIAVAGRTPAALGGTFNIVDDDLVTCRDWLRRYKRDVNGMRSVTLPYPVTRLLGRAVERYSTWSKGQLPPLLTPYKVASSWKGNRFTNERLKSIGWRPLVSTAEGLDRTFAWLGSRAT